MKKNIIIISIIFILFLVSFCGCVDEDIKNNDDETELIINFFNVVPFIITEGEEAFLSWNVTGASIVSINMGIGIVNSSGTIIITPNQNTTYIIRASNNNKSLNASVDIIVEKQEKDDESNINDPPNGLTIDGPDFGHQHTAYMFNATAYDPNENDKLHYIFNWGDGTSDTSDYKASETIVEISHDWSIYGIYSINVYAEDESNTRSETKTHIIYIDVHLINGVINGYLLDQNSDGIFDRFYNYANENETNIQKQMDGTYLIDSNGDDEWDYNYNFWIDKLKEI
jgi:hypothetical protein